MITDLNQILVEWSYRTSDGKPDVNNSAKLILLEKVLDDFGWSREARAELLGTLMEAPKQKGDKIDPETKVKYKIKDKDGKDVDKETTYKSAINREKDSPAYIAAKALQNDGGDKKDGEKLDEPSEFDRGVDSNKGISKDFERPKSDDSENDSEEESKVKPFSKKTQENHKGYIESAQKIKDNEKDPDRKKALSTLVESWEKFTNAKTEEEKIEAVESLVDNGLIERNQFSEKSRGKIYISSNAMGVPYKHFMGGKQGDAVTEDINRIIRENGLEVNMRNNSADRALADLSGKHNEAGVVALLDPSEENQKQYEELRKKYQELGNDDSEAHEQNKTAVELIKKSLPEGSKVTESIQVGGIGGSKLMDLYGIDEKVDPTDMLVVYDDKDGNKQTMKISAKIYSNPNDITMKNSGTKTAGKTYLGDEIGSPIDAKLQEMRDRNNYQEDGITDLEQKDRKRAFREEYIKGFGAGMKKLAETEEGQKQLVQMWKDVHGCGHDVHTLIVNKKTGESQIKPPEHYCDPKPPFDIKYEGGKVVINLETQTDEYVQVDCKTEMNSSPKLLFKHKVKRK